MPQIHQLLVDRLIEMYFWIDVYRRRIKEDISKYEPIAEFVDERIRVSHYLDSRVKDDTWDCGRVRYFYDCLRQGLTFDPIRVECGASDRPECLTVNDGHHRLVAAQIFKAHTIPATYLGREDVLDYLLGESDEYPA